VGFCNPDAIDFGHAARNRITCGLGGGVAVDSRRLTERSELKTPWMAAAATMGFALAAGFVAIAILAFSNARDPATMFAWFKTTPPPV
jgi:hypothetical protein